VASAASSPTLHLPSRKLFVGRQELLLQIEDRLQSNQPIGLVGSPGMGKSALALETAYRFADRFPDGCFWVDLRGNDAPSATINLLRSLGRSGELKFSFEELCRLATNEFANKRALLILDNAEGIDDRQRDQLAAICPRTIITSRRAISRNHDLRIDKLSSEDALAIFRQSGIGVDEEPREAQKLIERLGWLALAVVSTARRMSLNSPPQSCAQALAELSDGATLMEKLQLPRRHTLDDTVAESFALSYRELDNELQAAFHALGLCAPSGASAQAIAAMLETTEAEARELLLVLAERSLIEFDGERAEMHPLMHEYAETQVQQQVSQKQAIILRHVKYFGLEIGGAYKKVLGNEDGEDRELKQIDVESDNVRLAQIRALEDGFADPELAVELTIGMEFYWRLRDEPGVFDWLCCAHKLAKQVGSNLGQANVLQAIGDVQSFRKEMDAALGSYDAALKLFKQVGSNLGQANVLQAIGDVQSFRDEKDAALGSYDAALKLFKQVGSNLGQANVLQAIGDVQSFRDEKDAALGSYDAALKLFKQVGDNLGQANVLLALARTNGDAEHYEAAIRLYEKIGDRYSIARGKAFYGNWLLDQQEREKAVPLLQEAKAIWQQIGFEPGVNWMDELLSAQTDNADD